MRRDTIRLRAPRKGRPLPGPMVPALIPDGRPVRLPLFPLYNRLRRN